MSYQPKVMWGLSWRQMATVGIGVPVVGAVYGLGWVLGSPSIGEWLVVLVTIPFVLYGWVRPKGLAFEVYAAYVLAAMLVDKQLVMYVSTPVFAADMGVFENAGSRSPRSTAVEKSGRKERESY